MTKIAIQDANILIDLLLVGMLDYCLALPYQFCTTELILDELHDHQAAAIQPHIHSGKFIVISISPEELQSITQLVNENDRLSPQDWSAIYYAEQREALLLSGDGLVRKIAAARKLAVCGTSWILDELVVNAIITSHEAAGFLRILMDNKRRLPEAECRARLKRWGV